MGTKVGGKHNRFFPMGNYGDNSNSNLFHVYDANYANSRLYERFKANPLNGCSAAFDKEMLKRTMLTHEAVFKAQVCELHRLYKIQKRLMNPVENEEQNGCSKRSDSCSVVSPKEGLNGCSTAEAYLSNSFISDGSLEATRIQEMPDSIASHLKLPAFFASEKQFFVKPSPIPTFRTENSNFWPQASTYTCAELVGIQEQHDVLQKRTAADGVNLWPSNGYALRADSNIRVADGKVSADFVGVGSSAGEERLTHSPMQSSNIFSPQARRHLGDGSSLLDSIRNANLPWLIHNSDGGCIKNSPNGPLCGSTVPHSSNFWAEPSLVPNGELGLSFLRKDGMSFYQNGLSHGITPQSELQRDADCLRLEDEIPRRDIDLNEAPSIRNQSSDFECQHTGFPPRISFRTFTGDAEAVELNCKNVQKQNIIVPCSTDPGCRGSECQQDKLLSPFAADGVTGHSIRNLIDLNCALPCDDEEPAQDFLMMQAAENIVALSKHVKSDDADVECCLASPTPGGMLLWLAEVASEVHSRLQMDDFECETLALKEAEIDERRAYRLSMPELKNPNRKSVAAMLLVRPRRGLGRKRRQKRDFQKDILPGLALLSRSEVTEDLRSLGVLPAKWAGKHRTRTKAGRTLAPAAVAVALTAEEDAGSPVSVPAPARLPSTDMLQWGRTTRRCSRRKCPPSSPPPPPLPRLPAAAINLGR